jgi:hypothetical protein
MINDVGGVPMVLRELKEGNAKPFAFSCMQHIVQRMYGPELEGLNYPFRLQHFTFQSERQSLQIGVSRRQAGAGWRSSSALLGHPDDVEIDL